MRNWPQALLLVIVVASLVFAYSQWSARRRLEVAVGNQYFRSFFDLLGNVDNVRVALSKSLASGSPRLRVGALSDVWREASAAQANLNNLPVTHAVLARTSAFLTQVGDFAFTTARKVASQQVMSDGDWTKLVDLKKQSEDLARGLAEMETQASSGKISWVKVAEQAKSEVKRNQATLSGSESLRPSQSAWHRKSATWPSPYSKSWNVGTWRGSISGWMQRDGPISWK
jgi:spore germination protein